MLLGLSVGTSVVAGGITSSRGTKGAGPESPGAADFISSGGVVMPERFQFFVWTLVGVIGFVSIVLATDPAQLVTLPAIPGNFSLLMGVSSAGYLAGKTVRAPGPVLVSSSFTWNADRSALLATIVGQNLDAGAKLRIKQQEFMPDASNSPTAVVAPASRRTQLSWTLPSSSVDSTTPNFEVVNLDGQSAAGSFSVPV